MPLSLLNHPALALFAQRTRIPTSARSIGFCAIWVCISSSSSSVGLILRTSKILPYGSYTQLHLYMCCNNKNLAQVVLFGGLVVERPPFYSKVI